VRKGAALGSLLYTRGGDRGETSLVDGTRVRKDSRRVDAYGEIDELNSHVGLARARLVPAATTLLDPLLEHLQSRLYNCSSSLASPPRPVAGLLAAVITEEDVAHLERGIDALEEVTGPIGGFILPGGTEAASTLHVARTVCRRAERRLVKLDETEPVSPFILKFVNRASDLLFAAARYANRVEGRADTPWEKNKQFGSMHVKADKR
jgi:cob(I)alamin adenosyltransferase